VTSSLAGVTSQTLRGRLDLVLHLARHFSLTRRMQLMASAVLFDLGNTLAAYYQRGEFRPILEGAISGVLGELRSRRLDAVSRDAAVVKAVAENRETDTRGH
jgi:hypothetical protein